MPFVACTDGFHFFRQIGEVVDGPRDGLKRPVLDGKEYDHGE